MSFSVAGEGPANIAVAVIKNVVCRNACLYLLAFLACIDTATYCTSFTRGIECQNQKVLTIIN